MDTAKRGKIKSMHKSLTNWVNIDLDINIAEDYVYDIEAIEMLIENINKTKYICNKRLYIFYIDIKPSKIDFIVDMKLVSINGETYMSKTVKINEEINIFDSYNKLFESLFWIMSWCTNNNVIYVDYQTPIFPYQKTFLDKKSNNKVKYLNLFDGEVYMKNKDKLIKFDKKGKPFKVSTMLEYYNCIASSYYISLSKYNELLNGRNKINCPCR